MQYKGEEKSNHQPSWQEVLRNGEITPPDSLWEAIEAQLPPESSRKIIPFWWTSPLLRFASSVFLVLGTAAGLYIWNQQDDKTTGIVQNSFVEKQPQKDNHITSPIAQNTESSDKQYIAQKTSTFEYKQIQKRLKKASSPVLVALENETESVFTTHLSDIQPISTREWEAYGNRFSTNKRRFLAVPTIELEEEKEKPAIAQKTWIQVGGGVSPFNPQLELADFPSVASAAVLNTISQNKVTINSNEGEVTVAGTPSGPTDKSSFETLLSRPSQTFRTGISNQWSGIIGKKISPRWQLESGIRLMTGRSSTSGNVFAFDEETGDIQPFFEASYLAESSANRSTISTVLAATEQTDVSFQYIGIPIQVGYTIPLAAEWQVVVYSGISTDFFRNYRHQLEGGSKEKVFQSTNSRFRPVTWSGVGGVRIARTFQENWQVMVGVQMQESLTSGLDSQTDATFRPRMFGIQYGVGYVF